MPIDGRAGKVEPLYFRDCAELLCSRQHTAVANQRSLIDQTKWSCGKIAAELAAIAVHVITGLGRHRKLMARFANSLLRSMKQRFGHCARIRTAPLFAFFFDGAHPLKGVVGREAKSRAEYPIKKFFWGFFVVIKNKL